MKLCKPLLRPESKKTDKIETLYIFLTFNTLLIEKKSLIHGENSVLLKIYAKVNQLSKKTLSTILYHA